jgi:hypothetical protein
MNDDSAVKVGRDGWSLGLGRGGAGGGGKNQLGEELAEGRVGRLKCGIASGAIDPAEAGEENNFRPEVCSIAGETSVAQNIRDEARLFALQE